MTPVSFKQANGTLTGGPGADFGTDQPVGDLPVCRTGQEIISCFRPTIGERLSILFFGRVWLRVASPRTHPPVGIDGDRTIFFE